MSKKDSINLLAPEAGDSLWKGRLVADTRIRLANIFAGRYDEKFFRNMYDIIKYKIHYGYRTVTGQDVELKGIKDFFYNKRYGLGIIQMMEFMNNVIKAAKKDKSEDEIAYRFLMWLKKEDDLFDVDQDYCEYKRLQIQLRKEQQAKNIEDRRFVTSWGAYKYSVLKTIYKVRPDVLQHIGEGRKYENIEEASGEADIIPYLTRRKYISRIKIYEYYTKKESIDLAKELFASLGPINSKQLITNLTNYYNESERIRNISRAKSSN